MDEFRSEDTENILEFLVATSVPNDIRIPLCCFGTIRVLRIPSHSSQYLRRPPDFREEEDCQASINRQRCHSQCWSQIWYGSFMGTPRKITVEVPQELLDKAQRASGTGITQTVRTGLQLVAASQTYARLRQLRGKVRFTRTLAELKADR